ncbi:MFS-type transporter SLC18B1-like isoform X1 [Patiria miniata]|uniref:Major facilitator superfamily (MFS) profile domain-containing protein n=1 Tax=Patiria miniata TaxID=46514 RepID=A0A913ZMF5_PATMI|nr:MFS-type transporter SLC18B1-like isoform X1 [Patiria miniata]XP_038052276.1 MFS-type transporter SLC18B1-like isoform X1 [Patiria miniata]XP_038052277.1 MFS-type transporter SLC18B1-like isoform X1 [Patiria miniata]
MENKVEINASPSIEYVNSSGETPPNGAPPTSSLANKDRADEENDNIDKRSEEKPAGTKFTYHQKATFASAMMASLSNMMAASIISVFYPIEAKAKGMNQTVIGLVFSAFALTTGIGSPIWGKFIPVFGARFIFLAGAFVTGGCNVLFGFIVDMPTRATFTAFSFAIRLLEGLGSSATKTASAAIVAFTFPENVGTAVSLIEMTGGLAYAIGPAIGGLLYDAGGFRFPFFALGGLVLAIDIANFFLLPQQGQKKEESGPLTLVLSIPAIWLALLAVFVAAISLTSLVPTVPIHLKELGFTVLQISFIFLSFGLSYAISSVIWGAVADAKKATRIMMVFGAFGSALFFLFLGPSQLLKIPSTKLLAILVIPTGTVMMGLFIMPTFVDMYISAEWYGVPTNLGVTSIIAGLWNGVFAFGSLVGPLLGGALTQVYGFAYATTIFAGALISVMIVLCLFGVWEYRCGKGRRVPRSRLEMQANTTDEEQVPLIPNDV